MSRSLTHSPVSGTCQPSATAVLVDREPVSAGMPLYQAVGDHTPNHDGELAVTTGDIVTSVRQLGNGWALGRNESAADRPSGIFPVACVVAVAGPGRLPGAGFVECRRCGGSLPLSRIQPSERVVPQGLLSGQWDCAGPVDTADAAAPREEDRGEIELVPQSSHAEPLPQGTATAAASGEKGESGEAGTGTTRVLFPSDDLVDSPSTVPRRPAPLPPKPHLVVKPTRDKPAASNEYTIPSKCSGCADADVVTSPCRAKRGRRQRNEEEDDHDHSWCGVRSAGHRCNRGPPPPPPVRALSTFIGRSDPTLRQTVVSASTPGSVGADPTDTRCGCIDALGIARRHPALRSRRCHSGVPNGSSPSAPDLSFGVSCHPGVLRPGRPILKSRTPRVADSIVPRPASRRYSSASRFSVWVASCRLIGSIITGLLLGILTFAVLFYDQSCDVYVSSAAGFAVAVIAALALGVSRFCRCVTTLVPVSLSTSRGRVALCLIAFSVLLAGPVVSVHRNAGEAVRSLTCSAELALNRTASLLRPFDEMMTHLDRTVSRLEGAAADVAQGLEPLDEGLDAVEMDVENARTQLLGTRRVCYTTANK